MDRLVGIMVIVLVLIALVVGALMGKSIYDTIQDQNRYDQWALECNNAGKVIIDVGRQHVCLTWEEAKEKGVEFEVE